MIYSQLFASSGRTTPVRVGLIGAGFFGTSIATRSFVCAMLEVSAIADRDIGAAARAFRRSGVPDERIAICDSRNAALQAMERGRFVVVQDAMLLMDLPIDIVVESTGIPDAGAIHGLAAIRAGKHLAMVNKETDSVVGPILQKLAGDAGLVYTPVDGDQHGLMMGLIAWARTLGLTVLSAGKSRGIEFLHHRDVHTVTSTNGNRVDIPEDKRRFLKPIPPGRAAEYIQERKELLSALPPQAPYDLCEMVIAANAMNLRPDVPDLHGPAVRTSEIAEALCPESSGGILKLGKNAVDIITTLREPHEAGLGGGVFIVVGCDDPYNREVIRFKGCISNAAGDALLIYRPYHLCGVETAISLLVAGILGLHTGTDDYRPRYDMVKTTTREMKAGEVVGGDGDPSFKASLLPAGPIGDGLPIAAHLATGRKLTRDVPAGTLLTADLVELEGDSALLALRREQDAHFLVPK